MTQRDLAGAADTSPAYISQIESGKVALPGPDMRRRVARALGVTHLDLLMAASEISRDEIAEAGIQLRDPNCEIPGLLMSELRKAMPLTPDRTSYLVGSIRNLLDLEQRIKESMRQDLNSEHDDNAGSPE